MSESARHPNEPTDERDRPGVFAALGARLAATREKFRGLFSGHATADEAWFEELEAALLSSDAGVEATTALLRELRSDMSRKRLVEPAALRAALRARLLELLEPLAQPLVLEAGATPRVVMVVGVNGSGKTTTIGKLASQLKRSGHRVLLAAGDTFRAAAVEQLVRWGERSEIPVIAQGTGADSAAVAHDAMQAAAARGATVLIVDTAGRLQTQAGLMDELKKVRRIITRFDADAPHEVLLVLDGNTGQNALSQLAAFDSAVGVTGLAITKLDGTAKGGVLLALARKQPKPLRFIGVGEGIEDLRPFDAAAFVDAILPPA